MHQPAPRRAESPWHLLRRYARPMLEAALGEAVTLAGLRLQVPGPRIIRLSVAAGNVRFQRLCDLALEPGSTVVDVGANIGYNTLYVAQRVGPQGRVYAVEPAQDNLSVLYANLFANKIGHVTVLPFAAGRRRELRTLYLRGEISAVNSLYPDSFYADVTEAVQVPVAPLDDLVTAQPDLVKIDVEGAELEVLGGMERMLQAPHLRLIVEWHPVLQESAGHSPDALPHELLGWGFHLYRLHGLTLRPLGADDITDLLPGLVRARRPIDLLAAREPAQLKGPPT